jgi:hypothetical protein
MKLIEKIEMKMRFGSTRKQLTSVSSVHFCENFVRCLFNTFAFAANFPHVYKLPLISLSPLPDTGVFFNEETCKILQSSAIYHSINQRQDEALSDQDQMLHVITSLNLSGDKVKELTRIKLPLLPIFPTCINYFSYHFRHYQWLVCCMEIHSIARLCLYNYEFGLSLCKIVRSSVILLLPLFTILNIWSWHIVCP